MVIYLRFILSASNAANTISRSDIVLEYLIINTIVSITSHGGTFDMTNEQITLSSVKYKSINKFLGNMSESLRLVNIQYELIKLMVVIMKMIYIQINPNITLILKMILYQLDLRKYHYQVHHQKLHIRHSGIGGHKYKQLIVILLIVIINLYD